MAISAHYTKTFTLSWGQLHQDAKTLARKLLVLADFKGIIAITRGGMIPAAIIARELDIHLVETICVSGYDWQEQKGETEVLKGIDGDGEGWLLVDDLVDTGRTAMIVKQMVPKAYFATLYAKPAGRSQVDTFLVEVSQDTWILFPWDAESQYIKPLAEMSRIEE